jgi:hypothetical protein
MYVIGVQEVSEVSPLLRFFVVVALTDLFILFSV